MKVLWIFLVAASGLVASCGNSQTVEKLKSFADKVCACEDAECAKRVQADYIAWWNDNKRARGSDSDRKDIEKAMQRYAECHAKQIPPRAEPAPEPDVPTVDLTLPVRADAGASTEPAAETEAESPEEGEPAPAP